MIQTWIPLMAEHRVIEAMIGIVASEMAAADEGSLEPRFIDTVVDFIRTYADRTHHGKEEDILFAELEDKDLSKEDRRMMDELVADHVFGRRVTGELVVANDDHRRGDAGAAVKVLDKLRAIIDFYPAHIEKEDKVFFPASRGYFTDAEEQDILSRFREFDRGMIHEKYRGLVRELSARRMRD